MRKIDKIYENIFDNYYIDLSEYLNHYLHKIYIKPNHLTLLSLITGIFSAYLIYTNHFFKALCLFQCSYLLDCMDGSMARTYKQETTFGDYFDHISDIIKLSILSADNTKLVKTLKPGDTVELPIGANNTWVTTKISDSLYIYDKRLEYPISLNVTTI